MRAKMVRPIALRLTEAEWKLLDAWVKARQQTTEKNSSASDVIRLALVVAGLDAIGSDEWARIAHEHHVSEEWTARVAELASSEWRAVETKLGAAGGSEKDRADLRKSIQSAIADLLQEHESIHRCKTCGASVNSEDLERKCPNGHTPTEEPEEDEEEIPF